jgi:hypothetical protein
MTTMPRRQLLLPLFSGSLSHKAVVQCNQIGRFSNIDEEDSPFWGYFFVGLRSHVCLSFWATFSINFAKNGLGDFFHKFIWSPCCGVKFLFQQQNRHAYLALAPCDILQPKTSQKTIF